MKPDIFVSFDEPDELTSKQQEVVQELIRLLGPTLRKSFQTKSAIPIKTADGRKECWLTGPADALVIIRMFAVANPATFDVTEIIPSVSKRAEPLRVFVLGSADLAGQITVVGSHMVISATIPRDVNEVVWFVDEIISTRMASVGLVG
jgi:hypothetical protein